MRSSGKRIVGVVGNPVLIQSDFGVNGNFELLAIQSGTIKHYARNNDDPAAPWAFLRDVIGVAGQGGQSSGSSSSGGGSTGGIANKLSGGTATTVASSGARLPPVVVDVYSPTSVSFFQSNYRTVSTNGDFEALVQLNTGESGGDYLTTYWYNPADNQWHEAGDINANGQHVSGVKPF